MIKLAKYLKPFLIPLIVTVALLFGQAMCDLNLPNLMSDIVNVGIQQGGITNATPEAISKKGMEFGSGFMPENSRRTVLNHYELIKSGDTAHHQYAAYEKRYPLLKTEDIYVLKKVSKEERAALNDVFGKSAWTFINFMKDMTAQSTETPDAEASFDAENVNAAEMYQTLPMFQLMPEEKQRAYMQKADETAESMRAQTGAAFVKTYNQELGVDETAVKSRYIFKTGAFMLLIVLAGGIATICVSFLASRIAAGFAKNIRRNLFTRIESFSSNEFDTFSTASLMTRTMNDVTQVQMLIVMGIRMVCYAPIMGIGGIIMALNKSVSMSWIIALAVGTMLCIILTVFLIAMPKFKILQKLVDKLNLVARENLSGLMVTRAFGTEKFEQNRYDAANRELTRVHLFVNRVMVVMMPAMMLMMNCISLLIIWVGGHQIAESTMQVGDMMAFMQYSMQIIMSFLMISMMFIMVPRASVSAQRITEVLETEPSIKEPEAPEEFDPEKKGVVEFKNVCFRYQGAEEDVLHDINFTAKPGETTAFIGSTGSGKSTLVNLIPRFYDVTEGEILLSGTDIRKVSLHHLRENIGYIPQKAMLLTGTIESNLKYGREDATAEELAQAIEVAQASEFISQKEEGINSPISESGANVSGGQKQRLSIARALVKNAPVYIFDDSFSALDFKTDAALRKGLKTTVRNSTLLIVAQRVSTIMHADQIIVLNEGVIVGKGTHAELMKTCETYREIALSQLSATELG